MKKASYCVNCWRSYKRTLATPEKVRRYHLARTYKINQEWVDAQLVKQNGACPVCSRPISLPGKAVLPREEAHVDHDHRYGFVRGLLCGPCNRGLGLFEDDVERLASAINYLKKNAKTAVDVDIHLGRVSSAQAEAPRRVPTVPEEKHSPDESIDSIVARMGAEVIYAPLLPSPKGKR